MFALYFFYLNLIDKIRIIKNNTYLSIRLCSNNLDFFLQMVFKQTGNLDIVSAEFHKNNKFCLRCGKSNNVITSGPKTVGNLGDRLTLHFATGRRFNNALITRTCRGFRKRMGSLARM